MNAPLSPEALLALARAMLAEGTADRVLCEITRSGTMKFEASKGGETVRQPMRSGMRK